MSSASDTNQAINKIAFKLEQLIASNSSKKTNSALKSNFDAIITKEITVKKYLQRIMKYTEAEIASLEYALLILNKFCSKTSFLLVKSNWPILLFICIAVSIKFNEDHVLCDKDFEK